MTHRTAVPAEFTEQAPAAAHDHGGATDPQLKFIGDLMAERIDPNTEVGKKFLHRYGQLAAAGELTKPKASEIIIWLKERPRVQARPSAEQLAAEALRRTPDLGTNAANARIAEQRFSVAYQEMELDGGETRRVGSIIVPGGEHAVPAGRYALDVTGDDRFANDTIFIRVWVGDRGGFNAQLQNSDNDLVKPAFKTQLDLIRMISGDPGAASRRYGHEFAHCGVCGRGLTNDASRDAGIGPVCARRMSW